MSLSDTIEGKPVLSGSHQGGFREGDSTLGGESGNRVCDTCGGQAVVNAQEVGGEASNVRSGHGGPSSNSSARALMPGMER